MFHQTFSLIDIPRVLILFLLECALSADNALILAAIIRPLDKKKRTQALWIGAFSAFFLRLAAICSLAYFIHFFWIQILGATYLLYLALAYMFKRPHLCHQKHSSHNSLWQVVVRIELVDFIFALDSIIAALGVTGIMITPNEPFPPKIWIVYLGGVLGLVMMRFAAKILATLMDYCHNLEKAAHYLVGWVALKLGAQALYTYCAHPPAYRFSLYTEIVFWSGVVLILLYGILPKRHRY